MKKKRQNQQYSKPLLDIAILTAGRVDLFEKCLNSILPEVKPEYKIQVCNNGHPSSEYEDLYKNLPQGSTVKRNNVDNGFSVGANTVMNSGNAPLILFVTDDVFLHNGTIEKLLMTMDDPSIGQCGLKLLFPEDSTFTFLDGAQAIHDNNSENAFDFVQRLDAFAQQTGLEVKGEKENN